MSLPKGHLSDDEVRQLYLYTIKELNDDVIKRLYLYSRMKVSRYNKNTILYFTMTGEDIAHEAIKKTLSGKRPWNEKKCPELLHHLMGCAKSIISNHANSKETNTIKRETDFLSLKKNEKQPILDLSQINSNGLNYEKPSDQENQQSALSEFKKIINYLSNNRKDLIRFAEEILINGRSKPKELASYFGITVKEVNVKKTALKRILKKLQEGGK